MLPTASISAFLDHDYRGHRPWKTLWEIYRRHKVSLILALIFYAIKSSPTYLLPVFTGIIIDLTLADKQSAIPQLILYGSILLVVVIQNVPTHMIHMHYVSRIMRGIERELRAAIARRMQLLSISFFKNTPTGAMQAKVLRDVEQIDLLGRTFFDQGLNAIFSTIAAIGIVGYREPRFLLVFLVMVPTVSLIRLLLAKQLRKGNRDYREQIEVMNAQVGGMIEMLPITRAHAAEEAEMSRLASKLSQVNEARSRLDRANAIFGALMWTAMQVFNILVIIIAVALSVQGILPMSTGNIIMVTGYFAMLAGSVIMLANLTPVIVKGFESLRSIGEVLESPDIEQNIGKTPVKQVAGEFLFENVSFTYRGTERGSLCNFSLHVQPGENIAIVGPSGSGKSTLMSLIMGFERPIEGRILLDGTEMNSIDLRTYRRFVGVVIQETLLFHGTLRDNILYGGTSIPDERVFEALKDASALDFVQKLPKGLDTIIGEHGSFLSGGQRQRIAIARALIRNPRVLILDEATSALDTASEALVQGALERLMEGRTTFIVAHRLSTVRNADRIIVLEDGAIMEAGTPQELRAKGGRYAQMCAMQQVN